jgi:Domain of unknown function (DUF1905)/Bacteriocin-protection, YdeI or OmpD-Associated
MQQFETILLKFDDQGEKTGWTYIKIPVDVSKILKPNNKKAFRIKGTVDACPIKQIAVMPMGDGTFILAINAQMRKVIQKRTGAKVSVTIELDLDEMEPDADLMECINDDKKAKDFYETFNPGAKRYYHNWVKTAKTDETKAKRIAKIIDALARGLNYSEMIREKN